MGRNADEIKTSICIIVGDDYVNLERCCDSILPLIIEPEIELVIVVTQDNPDTMQVAKKYTDRVLHKEWHPWDFSAARNYAIEQARGNYVMTLDSDEQVSQKSIYFLKDLCLDPQNRWDKPTYMFVVRNLHSLKRRPLTGEYTEFADITQPRFFLNDGEFRYDGNVHNKPMAKAPYGIHQSVIILHYGYAFRDNEELKEKKRDRSLPMMEQRLADNPDDLHVMGHIVKMYYSERMYDEAAKHGERFIELLRDADYNEGWFGFLDVFSFTVSSYLLLDRPDDAERIRAEAERYTGRLVHMYFFLAEYYANNDDLDAARRYYAKVAEIYEAEGSPYEYLMTTNIHIYAPKAYNWLAAYHYERGEYVKAGQYLLTGIYNNPANMPLRWDVWNWSKNVDMNIEEQNAIGSR